MHCLYFTTGCQSKNTQLVFDFSSRFWLFQDSNERQGISTWKFDFNDCLAGGSSPYGILYFYDLDKQKLISSFQVSDSPYLKSALSDDGILYYVGSSGAYAWDLLNNKLLWEVKCQRSKAKPAIHDNLVVFHLKTLEANAKYEGCIQAFNRFTGESAWKISGAYWTPEEFVIQDDMLYVTGFSGSKKVDSVYVPYNKILAIEYETGHIVWSYELGAKNIARRPILMGDSLIFGTSQGGLLLLDKHSGELLDRTVLSMEYWSPIFVNQGVLYYQDYSYNNYCAYDLNKRSLVWLNNEIRYDSADFYPILHNGYLYLTHAGMLVRLDIHTGQRDKNFSSFMVSNGHVYNGELWVLDPLGKLYLVE